MWGVRGGESWVVFELPSDPFTVSILRSHFVEKTLAAEVDDGSAAPEEELPLELRILASAAAQPPLKRARVDAVTATPVGGAALVAGGGASEEYWHINSTRSAACSLPSTALLLGPAVVQSHTHTAAARAGDDACRRCATGSARF
jgi:hypothetical protein